jgi:hypothetical protein
VAVVLADDRPAPDRPARSATRWGRIARACAVAACIGLATAPQVARAQNAADTAAARELFIEGSKLSRDGRWAEAKDRFERSLALKRAPITLYSLGVAQMSSGHHVEALESFRAFLAEPLTGSTEPYAEPARAAIEGLVPRVAKLDIDIKPHAKGLNVSVDRKQVPPAALGVPRLVNAGEHVIRAEAPGYASRTAAVTVAEGETKAVALLLTPGSDEGRTPDGGPNDDDFPVGPVVLMAGGGLAFGVGLTVGLLGVAAAGDAPTPDGPEADSARTQATAGDVVAGVGIAAAAAGLLWLLLDDSGQAPATSHLLVTPAGSPGLVWRF